LRRVRVKAKRLVKVLRGRMVAGGGVVGEDAVGGVGLLGSRGLRLPRRLLAVRM